MSRRAPLVLVLLALPLLGGLLLRPGAALGGPAEDALAAAVKKGEELWKKPWAAGQKACADCHTSGPNALKASRLKSYPKWDKGMAKVVTGQQKINQMIVDKSRGTALELGSDDLTALEAFVATLK
jgi:cytochrome c